MGTTLAIVVAMVLGAIVRIVYETSMASRKPEPVPPKKVEWDVDVEVLHVPPGNGDWEQAIQKQLDAVEDRSPDNELVSATSVNGRLILFYRRRK